jgi:hypothetical protein
VALRICWQLWDPQIVQRPCASTTLP